jgi:hypothetical protein
MEVLMKNLILFLFTVVCAALLSAGCEQSSTSDNPVSVQNQVKDLSSGNDNFTLGKLGRDTQVELARVRAATAKYQDIDRAIADGYADADLFIPHMGWHYLNEGLVDGEFDMEKPELLVYAPWPNGELKLVAAEYAVPHALSADPPEGFTGTQDVWNLEPPPFDLWTLHAWVWYNNPDGMFEPFNPRID